MSCIDYLPMKVLKRHFCKEINFFSVKIFTHTNNILCYFEFSGYIFLFGKCLINKWKIFLKNTYDSSSCCPPARNYQNFYASGSLFLCI